MSTIVHYVTEDMTVRSPGYRPMWQALCSVNNQRDKPSTDNPELVDCLRCLDRLTRPGYMESRRSR